MAKDVRIPANGWHAAKSMRLHSPGGSVLIGAKQTQLYGAQMGDKLLSGGWLRKNRLKTGRAERTQFPGQTLGLNKRNVTMIPPGDSAAAMLPNDAKMQYC